MDEGFPSLFVHHSRGGATLNGIRRDGLFLSRHKILVVVEAEEKTKKLGRNESIELSAEKCNPTRGAALGERNFSSLARDGRRSMLY